MLLISHVTVKQNTPALKIEPVHKVVKTAPVAPAPPIVVAPAAVTEPVPQPAIPTGSHEDWMSQAGISQNNWPAVDYIVSHESGWNYDATEPTTGAHGLPQALPYSKTGCGWSDPICQLRWANSYAVSRYGSWWNAQAYWAIHRNW